MDGTSEIHSHSHTHTELTPERMALMRLHSSEINSDIMSGSASQYGGEASSRTELTRSSSLLRRSFHSGGGGGSSYRSKFSAELTAQAESSFHALIDVITTASKEASSLKSVWERIIMEREMFAQEREELLTQITEVTTEMKQRESERSSHSVEVVERRKQIEKLVADLSTALAGVATEKKKVVDRDAEIEKIRTELREFRETSTRSTNNYERVRQELERVEFRLKAVEEERDTARAEADQYHRDLQKTTRERTDLASKLIDVTQKFDLSRKEALTLVDRLKLIESEREETLQEIDRLKEDARKARARAAESSKETIEAVEKYERTLREHTKLKEILRTVESERDEYLQLVENLRREIKDHATGNEETNDRLIEVTQKYESLKREIIVVRDTLRAVELERNESITLVESVRDSVRTTTLERDELNDSLTAAIKKADEYRRQITIVNETLRKTEEKQTEVHTESLALLERIKMADLERDDWRRKHDGVGMELVELRERIVLFEHEIRTLTEARNKANAELARVQQEYSEVTETITSYNDNSGELEFEVESLRTLLREAREQKERAISARNSADRERDEFVAKYEEKCRELERFEENMHAHYASFRASGSGGGESRTSRTITRTSNNASSSSQHMSSSAQEGGFSSSSAAAASGMASGSGVAATSG